MKEKYVPAGNNPSNYISCYIINMLTDDRIEFVTVPDGISETYSSEWQPQDVMGRSAPYYAYGSNPARSVDFSVRLDENLLGMDYKSTIDACKRLVYPEYMGSIVDPPFCYVRFGAMVKMYAIAESVNVSWDGVFLDANADLNMYSQVEIGFSFTELAIGGLPTASSLLNNASEY